MAKGETFDVHKLLAAPIAAMDNGAAEILRLKSLFQKELSSLKIIHPR